MRRPTFSVAPTGYARGMGDEKAKERSRATFDRLAANYEHTLAGWHSRRMKDAALQCFRHPGRGSVLDVGCGPGLLLRALAERDPEMSLAGLDISPEMIRVAKEVLEARADLRVGDAEALPWDDDWFDYLFCVDSFHHYPHPERALSEMQRVLKRGGHLILADPTAPPVIRQLANAVNPLLHGGDVRMYSDREMMRMLNAQGFEQARWSDVGPWGFIVTALAPPTSHRRDAAAKRRALSVVHDIPGSVAHRSRDETSTQADGSEHEAIDRNR